MSSGKKGEGSGAFVSHHPSLPVMCNDIKQLPPRPFCFACGRRAPGPYLDPREFLSSSLLRPVEDTEAESSWVGIGLLAKVSPPQQPVQIYRCRLTERIW